MTAAHTPHRNGDRSVAAFSPPFPLARSRPHTRRPVRTRAHRASKRAPGTTARPSSTRDVHDSAHARTFVPRSIRRGRRRRRKRVERRSCLQEPVCLVTSRHVRGGRRKQRSARTGNACCCCLRGRRTSAYAFAAKRLRARRARAPGRHRRRRRRHRAITRARAPRRSRPPFSRGGLRAKARAFFFSHALLRIRDICVNDVRKKKKPFRRSTPPAATHPPVGRPQPPLRHRPRSLSNARARAHAGPSLFLRFPSAVVRVARAVRPPAHAADDVV